MHVIRSGLYVILGFCLLASMPTRAETVAIVASRIIDGIGNRALNNTAIIVENDTITSLVAASSIPANVRVIDL